MKFVRVINFLGILDLVNAQLMQPMKQTMYIVKSILSMDYTRVKSAHNVDFVLKVVIDFFYYIHSFSKENFPEAINFKR